MKDNLFYLHRDESLGAREAHTDSAFRVTLTKAMRILSLLIY